MTGVFRVKVASTLKGLCEEIDSNYNTAKEKAGGGNGPMTLYSDDGGVRLAWSVVKVPVKKVSGRGGLRMVKG